MSLHQQLRSRKSVRGTFGIQSKPFYLHLQSQRQVLNHCTWETDNEVEKVVDLVDMEMVDSKEGIVSKVSKMTFSFMVQYYGQTPFSVDSVSVLRVSWVFRVYYHCLPT